MKGEYSVELIKGTVINISSGPTGLPTKNETCTELVRFLAIRVPWSVGLN